jgi:hypothetical protein
MTRLVPMVGLVLWLGCGCIPIYPTVRKEKSGLVVDVQSGRPISGATVRVESYQVSTPPGHRGGATLIHSLEVKTDGAGRWRVPSERDWTIGILAADGLPLYADVYCVFAVGYLSAARNPVRGWLDPGVPPEQQDLRGPAIEAELRLDPLSGPPPEAGRGCPAGGCGCRAPHLRSDLHRCPKPKRSPASNETAC